MEKIESLEGEEFYKFVTRVKEHLRWAYDGHIEVVFRGVTLTVRETSNIEDLYEIYKLTCVIHSLKGE